MFDINEGNGTNEDDDIDDQPPALQFTSPILIFRANGSLKLGFSAGSTDIRNTSKKRIGQAIQNRG